MNKQALAGLLSSLTQCELEELRTTIDHRLNSHLPASLCELVDGQRFAAGMGCPHCQGTHIHRNGKRREKQRYACLDCGMTFGSTTGSMLSGTSKDISVWMEYCQCMANKFSLRKSAEICGIDL